MFPQTTFAADPARQAQHVRRLPESGTRDKGLRAHATLQRMAQVFTLALALALIPAPHAAETRFSIRLTPDAAALIAALHHGRTLATALADLPHPGSERAFAQTCQTEGGDPSLGASAGIAERVCL